MCKWAIYGHVLRNDHRTTSMSLARHYGYFLFDPPVLQATDCGEDRGASLLIGQDSTRQPGSRSGRANGRRSPPSFSSTEPPKCQ